MIFLGPHSHTPALIEVKFCKAKWTHVPVGTDKFDVNRCSESPLRGEKPDFWPVSKFNTGSLPLRGILPVITHDTTECRRALDIVTLAGNCFSTLPLTKILLGVAYLMRPLDAGYCYCFFSGQFAFKPTGSFYTLYAPCYRPIRASVSSPLTSRRHLTRCNTRL